MATRTINFPSLQPAIVCKVNVGAGHPVGMINLYLSASLEKPLTN